MMFYVISYYYYIIIIINIYFIYPCHLYGGTFSVSLEVNKC